MNNSPGSIADMVKLMSKKKRGPGRPKQDRLTARKLVRLTSELEAVVELHRRSMEAEIDEPVDFCKALRDLLRKGGEHAGLIKPPDQSPS